MYHTALCARRSELSQHLDMLLTHASQVAAAPVPQV